MTTSATTLLRGAAIASTVGFVLVLLWYLGQPGYTHVRLAFFVLLGVLAVVGAVGVYRRSAPMVAIGASGLFLIGFWQAVLWMFIYPVIALLLIAAFVDQGMTSRESTEA